MANNGFTVLAWVKPDSSLLQGLSEESAARVSAQLLQDFRTLIGFRWSMEVHIMTINGTDYAYSCNNRITVSDRTLRNAIGNLQDHVEFLRGNAQNTAEDLANFKECKRKWNVPDQVSESSSGWEHPERPATSLGAKRKLYF